MFKTLNNFIQILVGAIVGGLIGLIPVLIYYIHWQNLDRKTKPDGDTRFYTDRRIDDMRDQIMGLIDSTNSFTSVIADSDSSNKAKINKQQKAINELLIKSNIAEAVGQFQIPDGATFEEITKLAKPWKERGYIVRGNGDNTVKIYELPVNLRK